LQEQNATVRLNQLSLLFNAGNLMAADIVTAPLKPGPAPELPVPPAQRGKGDPGFKPQTPRYRPGAHLQQS